MKILIWNEPNYKEQKIACIGLFDGFHPGHLKLITRLMEIKKQQNIATLFLTISQNVNDFLQKKNTKLIDNYSKQKIIKKFGFDYYLEAPITNKFINLSAKQFLIILKKRFNVKKIVIGSDFKFGKNKEGNYKNIIYFFSKKNVYLIDRKNNLFSSTKIRNFLLNYDLLSANKLLYKNYNLRGKVKLGKQLGRTINFPTANIYLEKKAILPYGVYITETFVQKKFFQSITSYFSNKNKEIVETYLLNVNINLYEQEIIIYFKKFLRKNIKINNFTELIFLLKQDLKNAIYFFNKKYVI